MMTEKSLNHFHLIRFKDRFWEMPPSERETFLRGLQAGLQDSATCLHYYQISPLRADADLLLWSAIPVEQEEDVARFFNRQAAALNARRAYIEPVQILWGFTKPSQYARGSSNQEVDPFQAERKPYLIVYPFVKTIEWYLLSRDVRQGMMNQHIRIGHQYPEIKQLLLYSFGLQDQEFVVVYEADQLVQFSDLVNELRSSEARRYTERDTPNFTAIWHSAEDIARLYAEG